MSPRQPVTAAVVSPLSIVARGLDTMLKEHPDEVAVVDLLTGPGHRDPDVIVYDAMALLDGDGADLDFYVGATSSSVLAIGPHLRPELTVRAMSHGADSVCPMTIDEAGLVAAVLAATDATALVVPPAPELTPGRAVGLTRREVDILTLVTQGLTNLEIAELRYLSINSVKTYIRSAYRRIGVTSRSQAVRWCVQNGFATEYSAA